VIYEEENSISPFGNSLTNGIPPLSIELARKISIFDLFKK
jgi:hypothetical protein